MSELSPDAQKAWDAALEEVGGISEEEDAKIGLVSPKEEETSAPVEKAAPKAKEKPAKEERPEEEEESKQLGGGVRDLVRERMKLRQKAEAREKQFEVYIQQERQKVAGLAEKYAPHQALAEAVDAGDFEGIAQAVAKITGNPAIKDWRTLQDEALKAAQSPGIYREVRRLRAEREEERRQQGEQQRAWQAQQQQRERSEMERQWVANIEEELSEDEDEAVKGLLDAGDGIPASIYAVQSEHHGKEGEVLPTAEAAAKLVKTVWEKFQAWGDYFELHKDSAFIKKAIGDKAAAKKPLNGTAGRNSESGTTSRNGVRSSDGRFKKPAPAVSQNRTAEAAATVFKSDKDMVRHFARIMEEAAKTDPMFKDVT
jgi:hypothetical protein